MTIRFVTAWNGYYPDQIVSGLGSTEENRLIGLGYAVADLDGPGNTPLPVFATKDLTGRITFLGQPMPVACEFFGASPSSDAATNVAAIQKALNVAGLVTITIPGTYSINATLLIGSNTHFHLGDGVRLAMVSTVQASIIENRAYRTTARGVLDGTMTAGSNVFSSATVAFTSNDVGKTIVVQGAGASAANLSTTISSITSATSAVLADVAVTTTQAIGAYTAIGPRDENIELSGGYWLTTAAAGADDNTRMSAIIQRCDGVTVRNAVSKSTYGKYCWLLSDVTRVVADNLFFDSTHADGFHVNGPASKMRITNMRGTTVDDFVALLSNEYSTYASGYGQITDVVIDQVEGVSATVMVKLTGNSDFSAGLPGIDRVTCRNVRALGSQQAAVRMYSGNTANGLIGDVALENIYGKIGVGDGMNQSVIVSILIISGHRCSNLADLTAAITVKNASAITKLSARGIYGRSTLSQNHYITIDNTAQITHLSISDADWGGGTSTSIVNIVLETAGVVNLTTTDVAITNTSSTGSMITTAAGSTLTRWNINDCRVVQAASIGSIKTNTEIIINGLYSAGTGFYLNTAGYTSNIRGTGINTGGWQASAGTHRLWSFEAKIDVSLAGVSKVLGAMAYNTNSSLSCGAGPVTCDGTNWKHLFTGATY